MTKDPCLIFRDLTLGYNRHPAVHHLNGAVKTGSLTAVVGANGSGKSTLMKGIVGVLKPMAGEIVKTPGARIAYLPQQSELDRSFPARVVDLVSLGPVAAARAARPLHGGGPRGGVEGACRRSAWKASRRARSTRCRAASCSGRCSPACWCRTPRSSCSTSRSTPSTPGRSPTSIALIKRWHGEKRTVMVVVHDLDLVREHFPETLLLARQPVAWGDTARRCGRRTCSGRAASTRPGTRTRHGASRSARACHGAWHAHVHDHRMTIITTRPPAIATAGLSSACTTI